MIIKNGIIQKSLISENFDDFYVVDTELDTRNIIPISKQPKNRRKSAIKIDNDKKGA